jgi:hypothetical protein
MQVKTIEHFSQNFHITNDTRLMKLYFDIIWTTKNPVIANWVFLKLFKAYLFITYIVTSKPKRISVAAGVVHMIFSFFMYSQQNVVFVCFTLWAKA